MNTWFGLAAPVQTIVLAVVGLAVAAVSNHVVVNAGYFERRPQVSPWRHGVGWIQRLPVVGWWCRDDLTAWQRIRPSAIEATAAIAVPLLYHFEVRSGGLLPTTMRHRDVLTQIRPSLLVGFLAHVGLIALMLPATFIDFDEQTIPDSITVTGTIAGLIAGSTSLAVYPPTAVPGLPLTPTLFDSPTFGAAEWVVRSGGLAATLLWTAYVFALCDRRWSGTLRRRRGWTAAVRHLGRSIFGGGRWRLPAVVWMTGAVIIAVASNAGVPHRYGCLTALVGLAGAGGLVWAIRIIASGAMGREAMGFGDVTLMAMIGAWTGWQAGLLAFFLAPFTSIVIALTALILTGRRDLPFGPYLCAGTLLTLIFWDRMYNQGLADFLAVMGGVMLWMGLGLLAALGGMLLAYRLLLDRIHPAEDPNPAERI